MKDNSMILDNEYLKENHGVKSRHSYERDGYMYNQYYSTSTDYMNPFNVNMYSKDEKGNWAYSCSGSGVSIEDAYHSLIKNAVNYRDKYKKELRELESKIDTVKELFRDEDDDLDDRF